MRAVAEDVSCKFITQLSLTKSWARVLSFYENPGFLQQKVYASGASGAAGGVFLFPDIVIEQREEGMNQRLKPILIANDVLRVAMRWSTEYGRRNMESSKHGLKVVESVDCRRRMCLMKGFFKDLSLLQEWANECIGVRILPRTH